MSIDHAQLTQFTQALVRAATLSGAEKPAIDLAEAEMQRLGFDHTYRDANGSLVGIVQGAHPGPTLLLDAHVDTVGIAPGVPWNHDPFGAQIEGQRLYGRGSSDMKGSLAAMIYAAAALERSQLAGRAVVSASVLEEVLEGVALQPIMAEMQPDYVVIGEPTDLQLSHGGRGRAEIHLEAIGRPAHSSSPHLGINAVYLMVEAIRAMESLSLPSDPLLGPAILALTDIISEPYPGHSVIPSRCRVTYDRRLLVGETAADVLGAIQELPALAPIGVTIGMGAYDTYTGITLHQRKFFPAWKLPTDHTLVQRALAGLRAARLEPRLQTYRFCTNAAYSAGTAQVPTIGFGPSPESRAHVADEYIELADLHAAARGYQGIMQALLVDPGARPDP